MTAARAAMRMAGVSAWRAGLLGALALLGWLAGPGRAGTLIDRVAAVVNEEIILQSDLDQNAAMTFRTDGSDPDASSPESQRKFEAHRRKVLDQMIDKLLLQQQAKEMKLYVSEDEMRRAIDDVKKTNSLTDAQFAEALKGQGFTLESYRKQLRQQLLELKVINQAVRSRVTVDDSEVRSYYAQTVRQATGDQQQVHLRQIFITVPAGANEAVIEGKRKVALRLVQQLRSGADFTALAKSQGEDSASKAGGDLGWLARGDLPEELRETVASMDNGDLRGPVRSERGFHILQLVEKKDSDVRPFEEVKEQLRRQLYDQQVEKAIQSWIREIRRKAHIDIRLSGS